MKQLAAARAVITIWSPNSIRSDWVRAEAGAAKKDGKLIPVKTADVAYADIPLPFGEMHTEHLEASQLIRAAVLAQLAKPAVEPSAAALLTKGFKYELLTWVGIVGGALTLFGNLDAVLKLADWARVLVQHWKEWTHAFWAWAFGWLGIHLQPEWTPVLSFLLFCIMLTIGQAIQYNRTIKINPVDNKYEQLSVRLSWHSLFWLLLIVVGFELLVFFAMNMYVGAVIMALLISIILNYINQLAVSLTVGLMVLFAFVIVVSQIDASSLRRTAPAVTFTALALFTVSPIILLSVAPAKAISRRLIFLALGLLLLIALNELSKLGLDVTAPKLQG